MDLKLIEKGRIALKSKKKLHKKYNTRMLIILFFFIGGYMFFFSTKVWYEDNSDMVAATKMNTVKKWNNRDIQLINWEYSPKQRMMEVQLAIKNKSYDGVDTYLFKALERNKGFLTVEMVLQESGFYVLRIMNVPDKWSQIALFVDFEQETFNYCKFFTNKLKVANVDVIIDHTYNEYMVMRIDKQIASYEAKIQSLKADNEKQRKLIENYEKDILSYEQEKEFQTKNEQESTNRLIADIHSKIASAESAITNNKKNAKEYRQRIKLSKKERATYE